jgi:GTP-binding protein
MRKSFKAMTFDQPGVTRDRHYGMAKVEDERGEDSKELILVDTGGFYPEKVAVEKKLGKKQTAEPFFNIMADHAKLAIAESDLVLMVVDVREGLLPFDKTICDYIRASKTKMILLINKFDSDKQWGDEADFYELGLKEEEFRIVSAEHGRGLQVLKEDIHSFICDFEQKEYDDNEVQRGVKPNHDVVSNVAIIGAPNAGKSTLLNQFLGAKRALVSDIAGTTVDPIEGYCDLFFGKDVGVLETRDNQFRKNNLDLMQELETLGEEEEDRIMLAYDEVPDEYKFGSESDSDDNSDELIEFDEVQPDHFGIEDIEASVTLEAVDAVEDNAVESDEEVISEETKEEFNPFRSIKLVDTAGIRRQKSVNGFIEEQSVYRSLKSISEADVIIYMIDATKGISHQDRRLCDIALDKGKSIIICLNKVDLIRETIEDKKKKREWLLDLRASIPWLEFCEIITISAKSGAFLGSLKQSLKQTVVTRSKKIKTGRLNRVVSALVEKHPVVIARSGGSRFKVRYTSMVKAAPPTFLLFSNKSQGIPANYRKYITNGLRREFNMVNTPVHLIFRTAGDMERKFVRTAQKESKREFKREEKREYKKR